MASDSSGSNPLWYFFWPVADSAAAVRPWNELYVETILPRPVCFTASLSAASLASAPLLTKRTEDSGGGQIDTRAAAASACSLTRYRFETWTRRSA